MPKAKRYFLTALTSLRNRWLVWRFPFLEPRSVDGDRIADYDFSYTLLDSYPAGWRRVIVRHLRRIKSLLKRYGELDNFRVTDAKEKYGEARLYCSGVSSEECDRQLDELIWDMESDTGHTCCECGRPAKYVTQGYILPFCRKCIMKHGVGNAREI